MTRRRDEPMVVPARLVETDAALLAAARRLCVTLEPAHLGPTDGRPCPRCISEARRALAARSVFESTKSLGR